MKRTLEETPNLSLVQAEIADIITSEENGKKKIALVSGNRFVDILYMNDNLEVTMGYLKAEKSI